MRFTEMTPSSKDNQTMVYNFKIGATELSIIWELLSEADKHTPQSFMTQTYKQRLKDMKTKIHEAMKEQGVKMPFTKKNAPVSPKEVL